MKKFRLLTILILAFACVGFASCSDDDDFTTDDLIGTWKQTWSKGYEKYATNPDWDSTWDKEPTESIVMMFNSDGTGGMDGIAFTWKLDGNKLLVNAQGKTMNAVIKSLSSSTLMIEIHETGADEDGPYDYYELATFKDIASLK